MTLTLAHVLAAGLAALLALAARVCLLLASPTRRCPRCNGEKVARHRITRRLTGCPRCIVTGRCYRRGAVLMHRLRWSITDELRESAARRLTTPEPPAREDS
jgi:hypothetical protein